MSHVLNTMPPIPLLNSYTFSRDISDNNNSNMNYNNEEDNIIIWLVIIREVFLEYKIEQKA